MSTKPQVLSEILQRKTFYQVTFDHDFPEIYWLIELKAVVIIALLKTRKYFFSEDKKQTRLESLPQKFFYVKSKQLKTNSDRSEKYSENKHVSKKDIDNCHSPRRLQQREEAVSVLQNGYSEKFKKISNKTSAVIYSFWFY